MDVSLLILCIGLLTVFHSCEGAKPGQCRVDVVYKMRGADCSQINLVQIPVISRSVEILDASGNRIRLLKNNSFTSYDSLRFLYLFDNSISVIEPAAFEPLVYLEVLDLHLNSIREIPPLLPYTLRKLYLAENFILSIPLENAQSLAFLSLAENGLKKIPNMGVLPQLIELNVTSNPLEVVTIDQLSAFCQLKVLRLPVSLMTAFPDTCDCVRLKTWTAKYSIFVEPLFNCTIVDESECQSNSSINAQIAYDACISHQASKWSGTSMWILGVGCVILIVCILTVILVYLWRRKYAYPRPPPPQPSAEEVRKMKLLRRSTSRLQFSHARQALGLGSTQTAI